MAKKTKKRRTKKETFMLWDLPESPDGVEIAELVNAKVITPKEARDICFRIIIREHEKIDA